MHRFSVAEARAKIVEVARKAAAAAKLTLEKFEQQELHRRNERRIYFLDSAKKVAAEQNISVFRAVRLIKAWRAVGEDEDYNTYLVVKRRRHERDHKEKRNETRLKRRRKQQATKAGVSYDEYVLEWEPKRIKRAAYGSKQSKLVTTGKGSRAAQLSIVLDGDAGFADSESSTSGPTARSEQSRPLVNPSVQSAAGVGGKGEEGALTSAMVLAFEYNTDSDGSEGADTSTAGLRRQTETPTKRIRKRPSNTLQPMGFESTADLAMKKAAGSSSLTSTSSSLASTSSLLASVKQSTGPVPQPSTAPPFSTVPLEAPLPQSQNGLEPRVPPTHDGPPSWISVWATSPAARRVVGPVPAFGFSQPPIFPEKTFDQSSFPHGAVRVPAPPAGTWRHLSTGPTTVDSGRQTDSNLRTPSSGAYSFGGSGPAPDQDSRSSRVPRQI